MTERHSAGDAATRARSQDPQPTCVNRRVAARRPGGRVWHRREAPAPLIAECSHNIGAARVTPPTRRGHDLGPVASRHRDCNRTNPVRPVPSLPDAGVVPVAGTGAPVNPCGTGGLHMQRCRPTETNEALGSRDSTRSAPASLRRIRTPPTSPRQSPASRRAQTRCDRRESMPSCSRARFRPGRRSSRERSGCVT